MDKSYEQIKWPSERIPQGGLFHNPPKIEYSKETTELIKCKMVEIPIIFFNVFVLSSDDGGKPIVDDASEANQLSLT